MSNARRTLLATACAACATLTHAQSWCPLGAEWTFDFTTDVASQSGIVRVEYDGDTLLGGSSAQRLRQWAHVTETGMIGYNTWPWANLYTRATDDVVELYDPTTQEFDTLMWFAAQPGQHWTTSGMMGLDETITVTSTSMITVGGIPLRQLVVSGEPAFWFGTDTLTERAGFSTIYIMPEQTLIVEGSARNLRCYRDDVVNYSPTPLAECGFTVGIESSSRPAEIAPFPNPGTDHFTLSLPPGQHVITLVDATGRVALQQRASDERSTIDTAHLPSGMYVVRVDDGRRPARWVKQ